MINIIHPKVTVTEIQRKPAILSSLKDDEYRIVMKGNEEVGVLVSVALFNQLSSQSRPTKRKDFSLSPKLKARIAQIDPVKYQRQIRSEY